MLPLVLFSIAIVAALYAIQKKRGKKSQQFVLESLLQYLLPISIGVMGIVSFISHLFFSEETAKMIGWAAGNPFQYEVAAANLSIGIAGILCIYYKKGFWLATALISSIYLLFDAVVFVMYISMDAPGYCSWGFFRFFADFLIPLFLLCVALLYARHIAQDQ